MSMPAPDQPEDGGDDLRAAEFVLGVLSGDEQAALARRVSVDAAFARQVSEWEERLHPMAEGFAAALPGVQVKRELDRRLFGAPPRAQPWRRLVLWRGLSAVLAIVALLAISLPLMFPQEVSGPRLAAALASPDSDVSYLALYDPDSGAVGLSHVSGLPEADRVFELWLIRGEAAPVSVGVIPVGAQSEIRLDPAVQALIDAGALLAISLEPLGGSPTGQPTGPVMAAGDLRPI